MGHEENDFLSGGSTMCVRNDTYGSLQNGRIRCKQIARGRYVTIDNLVHLASDTYSLDYSKCLQLCEVKIFVTGLFYQKHFKASHILCSNRCLHSTVNI